MSDEVTQMLVDWRNGDEDALANLIPVVESELKRQARLYLSKERKNHTIQPTELVSEAFLRIQGIKEVDFTDRAHFFAITATAMRRVLVDHARRINSEKRGQNPDRVTLTGISLSKGNEEPALLDLDDALKRFAEIEERKARVVELRFFGGMTNEEIAEVLEVTPKTVQRDWNFAKLWLFRDLSSEK